MEANELRIGNWVMVPSLSKSPIIPTVEKQVKGVLLFGELDFRSPDNPVDYVVPAKLCSGIPLTPEWLERAGFECELDEWTASASLFTIKKIDDVFHWANVEEYTWSAVPIEYVHQLQNLYFAITGRELEIINLAKI